MGTYRFSFIFLDASKDLYITADEKIILAVITEFAVALAVDIDFSQHVIKLSCYRKNDEQFRKNIDTLVSIFKSQVPQVQQLPKFFKDQTDGEYFFIGYNFDLNEDEILKVNASLEFLNSGRPYQQTMDEINRVFGSVRQAYKIYAFYGASKKHFYGEKDKVKRVCRFCHGTQATGAKFTMDAHTISESIGNKLIFSYEECDICNDRLGSSVEQDFGEMLRIDRCYFGVKGKDGIPVVRGENFTMEHPEGGALSIKFFNDDDGHVPELDEIVLKYISRYNPQNIYRCLVKYALGVMPQEYVCHFDKVGNWVRNQNSLAKLPTLKKLTLAKHEMQPHIILYIRKGGNKDLPYAVGEFHVLRYIYSFIIPLCDEDDRDFCNQMDYDRFWNLFTHYNSIKDWQSMSVSIDNVIEHQICIKLSGRSEHVPVNLTV